MSDQESTLMMSTAIGLDVQVQQCDESIGRVQKLKDEYAQWKPSEPWNHLDDEAPGICPPEPRSQM